MGQNRLVAFQSWIRRRNAYIETQLERTEPNNELAKALNYLKNHWVPLTRFLSVPGAPIDNNIVERALKLAIRVRKNSLFYKSAYSAELSGMIISLIYTCRFANINPVKYLTLLQDNHYAVINDPYQWLPWLCQKRLKSAPAEHLFAAPQATSPPLASPVAG